MGKTISRESFAKLVEEKGMPSMWRRIIPNDLEYMSLMSRADDSFFEEIRVRVFNLTLTELNSLSKEYFEGLVVRDDLTSVSRNEFLKILMERGSFSLYGKFRGKGFTKYAKSYLSKVEFENFLKESINEISLDQLNEIAKVSCISVVVHN